MATQFTAGPLKAVGREVWVMRNGVPAGMLCRSVPETLSGSTYEQSPDEAVANAHLIAAAPDLYETGQAIIDRMSSTYRARNGREMGIQGEDGEKCWIVHSDDIEALRAALARARGEQ